MTYWIKTLIAAGLLVVWSGLVQSAVYKWVDERGVTNYTQYRPLTEQSEQEVKIVVPPASPNSDSGVAQERLEKQLRTLADNEAQRKEAAEKKTEAATAKKQRAEICAKARGNLAKLTTGGRKRIVGEDGVARYLTEEESQKLVTDAEKHIEESCS